MGQSTCEEGLVAQGQVLSLAHFSFLCVSHQLRVEAKSLLQGSFSANHESNVWLPQSVWNPSHQDLLFASPVAIGTAYTYMCVDRQTCSLVWFYAKSFCVHNARSSSCLMISQLTSAVSVPLDLHVSQPGRSCSCLPLQFQITCYMHGFWAEILLTDFPLWKSRSWIVSTLSQAQLPFRRIMP